MDRDASQFLNLWTNLNREERSGWLMASYVRWFAFASEWPSRTGGVVVELDGSLVDGLDAFFCAIGEAVNGPGGYFGKNINGFADCAVGGFGVERPWQLRWTHSERAREALGYAETLRVERGMLAANKFQDDEARSACMQAIDALARGEGTTLFETIVRILEERGVQVELL